MRTNNIYKYMLVGFLAFTFVQCDDNIDPLVTQMETARPFTPTKITATNGQTQATIAWNASIFSTTGDVSYVVEVSKNSDFSPVEWSLTTTNTQVVITNEDIQIKNDYYARVRPVDKNGTSGKYWIISNAFQITGEQIFQNVTEADLTHSSVTLKWVSGGNVTGIVLTTEGGSSSEYTITEEEKAANAKTITGLTQGTNYTAEIFNGTTSRGITIFTTFSLDVPEAELVIVLEDDKLIEEQIDFSTISASSVTVVFEQGKVYNSAATIVLTGNNTDLHFYGMPGPNKAVVSFSLLTLPAQGGKIEFSNLDLTGYPNGDPTSTKRAYIFNQSAASQTSEISFENCTIRNFANTPFRMQGANTISVGSIKVNNCIIYDISASQTYAFIHENNATNGKVDNIEITNSTFYSLRIGIIRHDTQPSATVTISNCTINDVSEDTRAVIDYGANAVGTFTFTSNVLGKTKGTTTVRGIRIGGASVSVPASSYKTTDFVIANNPIDGLTDYTGSSTDLFINPAAGNFNFKDTNFAGKSSAGDPRWRQ